MNFLEYTMQNKAQVLSLLGEHIQLTFLSVGIALLLGVPLGILICYVKKTKAPILGTANLIQAIPSMALLGFAIPFLGIGTTPAVTMVILYSLLPIIKNTYTGIENINPQMIEAARGLGMTKLQVLTKVQIPLALPVIMAGVRISAVTAVGLMTIAAFIGAGGLGYLVFSGIRTVNNAQILAGAIPACLLALLVDYLAGLVENLVTPISLQKKKDTTKEKLLKTRKQHKLALAGALVAIFAIFAYNFVPAPGKNAKVVSVATKDFTEQLILGHMISDLIEDRTEIAVNRRINLGGTQVCFTALASGDIDLYIDYTGTAYGDTLKYPPISDMEKVYTTVKKDLKDQYNIDVLQQMGFNNTYTLAVTQETAAKYQLKTISDLSKAAANLTSGTTLEFLNRQDGLPGLLKKYNFDFKNTIGVDGSPRYAALITKETDIIDAFSTDGLLKKYNLVTLEDDRNFFPPYYAIPLIRAEIAATYPEILPLLDELGMALTNDTMIELNYQVDELHLSPEKVARTFLEERKLIAPSDAKK